MELTHKIYGVVASGGLQNLFSGAKGEQKVPKILLMHHLMLIPSFQ